jgi:hypothetical protein
MSSFRGAFHADALSAQNRPHLPSFCHLDFDSSPFTWHHRRLLLL